MEKSGGEEQEEVGSASMGGRPRRRKTRSWLVIAGQGIWLSTIRKCQLASLLLEKSRHTFELVRLWVGGTHCCRDHGHFLRNMVTVTPQTGPPENISSRP